MSGAESGVGGDGNGPMLARVFDLLRGIQEELRAVRKQGDLNGTALQDVNGALRRMERRLLEQREDQVRLERLLLEQKDDLDAMIRAELAGQLGMLRAELGSRVDGLADRVAVLEGRDPWQEAVRPGPRS